MTTTARGPQSPTGWAGRTVSLSSTTDGRAVPPLGRRFTPLVHRHDRLVGWVGPLAVALVAGVLRFWRLGDPAEILFDETYYAKDAYSLLKNGYVLGFVDKANNKILAGNLHGLFTNQPSEIVHPDGGKWLIAAGEGIFGMNPFGWRFASALVGTLTVLVLCRLVRRLSGSTLVGCIAGLLLCCDALSFVMSRLALLDGFLAFWLVCAVACLVADRDWGRLRMARMVAAEGSGSGGSTGAGGFGGSRTGFGPVRGLLLRPWRLGAGACFGLACGTKWDGVFALAGFGLLLVAWDAGARRAIGVRHSWRRSLLVDGVPAFCSIVLVALVAYLATWTGWLMHAGAYEREFGETNHWGSYVSQPAHGFVGSAEKSLKALWDYHQMVYDFHTGKYIREATHPYQSNPGGWLIINRPVGIDAQTDIKPGDQGCDAPAGSTCLRQVLAIGTPVLWWGGVVALAVGLVLWVGYRDWRFGVPIVGVLSMWLPWFRYDQRTIFFYYAVAFIPFTVIAVSLVLGRVLGPADASPARRRWGTVAVTAFVLAVVGNFAFFYPILADYLVTNAEWLRRMWFKAWV